MPIGNPSEPLLDICNLFQEIVDNDLLKTCVNEAKSAIKIRIGVYKDNLDKARNKPANEGNWMKAEGGKTKTCGTQGNIAQGQDAQDARVQGTITDSI